jgi:hypothetical protein
MFFYGTKLTNISGIICGSMIKWIPILGEGEDADCIAVVSGNMVFIQ